MGEHKQNYDMGVERKKPLENRVLAGWILFIAIVIFGVASVFKNNPLIVISQHNSIILHIILKLLSIIVAFCIFAITYYTSERTRSLMMTIIACTFLSVTIMNIIHIFSYEGMPDILDLASPNKATAIWIISRLTMSLGIFLASLTSSSRKMKIKQWMMPIATGFITIGISLFIAIIGNPFPQIQMDKNELKSLKIAFEYLIGVLLITAAFIYYKRGVSGYNNKPHTFIIIGLSIGTLGEFAFTLYKDLYDNYNLLGHIYKFVAFCLLFRALFIINIQKPYEDLSLAEEKLNNYVDDLEHAVSIRTKEIMKANKKIMKNLRDAKQIQMALMVIDFPRVAGMEFAAKYLPCEQVGGDFYNVFRLDEENIGIVIGDVAGHGVSAAMVNVFINQNMRFRVDYDENRYRILTPRGVLMNLYHVYNNMYFPEEIYVVLLYGIYNTKTGVLSYASAGMNTYPLILGANGEISHLELGGFPICKFGEFFKPSYETKTFSLAPGDTLIFHSDGLGEIDRSRPDLFTTDKIKEFLKGLRNVPAQKVCNELFEAYDALLEDREMLDDVTILVMKTPGDVA